MKPKLTLVEKTVKLPPLVVYPALVIDMVREYMENAIKDLEAESYCKIAGISREEYELINRFPGVFHDFDPNVIDLDFEDEA